MATWAPTLAHQRAPEPKSEPVSNRSKIAAICATRLRHWRAPRSDLQSNGANRGDLVTNYINGRYEPLFASSYWMKVLKKLRGIK